MKLSVKAMTITVGLFWGVAFLLVALINVAQGTYGATFLRLCSSLYPKYQMEPTIGSALVGTLYSLVEGAVGGAIFAWLYNAFAKLTGSTGA